MKARKPSVGAKLLIAAAIIVPFVTAAAIISLNSGESVYEILRSGKTDEKPDVRQVDESAKYSYASKAYGVDSGNLVQIDPKTGEASPFYQGEKMYEGVVSGSYIAFLNKDYEVEYGKIDEPDKTQVGEVANSATLSPLVEDSVMYLTSGGEHDAETGTETAWMIVNVLHLPTGKVEQVGDSSGVLKLSHAAVNPAGSFGLFTTGEGVTHLYDFKKKSLTPIEGSFDKGGFINNVDYWVTKANAEGVHKSQKRNIRDSAEADLNSMADTFDRLSLLDIKQVGDKYVIIGNSYEGATPQQMLYVTDLQYGKVDKVLSFTEIGANSGGRVIPVEGAQYMIDIRNSSNGAAAYLLVDLATDRSEMFPKVSSLTPALY